MSDQGEVVVSGGPADTTATAQAVGTQVVSVDVIVDAAAVIDVVVAQGLPGPPGTAGPNMPPPTPADIGKVVIVRDPGTAFVLDYLAAADVAGLGDLAALDSVGAAQIDDGSVTTAKIVDANVTAPKLATGAAVANIGYTPANKAGDTFTGPVVAPSFNGGTFDGLNTFVNRGAAGTDRIYYARTGTLNRWGWGANPGAEGGANAGSGFVVYRFNDAGAFLGTPLTIDRATGVVDFATRPTVAGVPVLDDLMDEIAALKARVAALEAMPQA